MSLLAQRLIQERTENDTEINSIQHSLCADRILNIRLSDIINNPRNRAINQSKVNEYAESIKEIGLIEDPVVTDTGNGTYMILSGHHRIAAYRLLSISDSSYEIIRCKVTNKDEIDSELILLHANIKNNPLTVYEKMMAIGREEELLRLKQTKGTLRTLIAQNTGLKDTQVQTNLTVYKKAVSEVKEALKKGDITLEKARRIAQLPKAEQLNELYKKNSKQISIFQLDVQNRMMQELQTKVTITEHELKIAYTDISDLNRILTKLDMLEPSLDY